MSRKSEVLRFFEAHRDYAEERIKSGIELYRKGAAEISVTLDGKPFDGRVKITQKNHEFRFGANLFMLGEFENETKNELYKEKFAKVFNLATLPFYWDTLEPEKGKPRFAKDSPPIYRRPPIDLCMEYCEKTGIEPKAHCLNYDMFTPAWAHDLTVPEFKKALSRRMRVLAERYADRIPSWEVTNETFSLSKGRNPTKFYYEDDFLAWSYRTADRFFPENHFIINDYMMWDMIADGANRDAATTNRARYYMQIERLLRDGTHIDSIGMQYHNFFDRASEPVRAAERYDPVHLYKELDNYAKLGKRIQITEMTVPAYSEGGDDEEVQAELLYNTYRVFFSHPAMEAIIYWNLVDGYAYSKNLPGRAAIGNMETGENTYHGGLLRFDLSEKPAFRVLDRLFHKEWHTELKREVRDGRLAFRGFYGDYDITFEKDGKLYTKTVSLSRDTKNVFSLDL